MRAAGAQRILLLHPADQPARFIAHSHYDLVVDLGRAPASTYEAWSRVAGCRVMSIHDLSRGVDDLRGTRKLLEFGMGEVVDQRGIDWCDVLIQSAVPSLQQLILAARLADVTGRSAEIHSTRPHFVATALQHLTGSALVELQSRQNLFDRAKHYVNAFRQLNFRQFTQVLQDKFDPEHNIRRRFAQRKSHDDNPLVLLPSAYVNVSRTAIAYAEMVPDVNFLLVTGRNSGRLTILPSNVQMESLDSYFSGVDESEIQSLLGQWSRLEQKLKGSAAELAAASVSGVLANAKALLRWGIAVRNAWIAFFESHNISSCLCADDSNPYSRVPLILAGKRGIPAITCHHGALDSRVAIKKQHADLYLAKGEMENDFLTRVCQLAPNRIVVGAPCSSSASVTRESSEHRRWLVFFTEPYQAMGWRTDDVYAELLPRLVALQEECELELVFKLHPFESIKGHRRLLRRFLAPAIANRVQIIAGPMSSELWTRVGCALTVQSTVALDCAERNIPIFLCGWLADASAGYVQQYARFGVGCLLESPNQMALIPEMISKPETSQSLKLRRTMQPEVLRDVLSGRYPRAAVLSA
jgi:hypothetical protein